MSRRALLIGVAGGDTMGDTMDANQQRIGDYLLTELLGEDEVGQIYLAEHAETGDPCALSILHEDLSADKRFGERFRSVSRTLTDLTHGRIVGVKEMRRAEGRYFVAMEYVSGPRGKPMSLEEYLAYRREQADGAVQMKLVRVWAIQIAEAMAFAHDNGQRHHSLGPDKVLIDAANNVKVSGFGLAQMAGEEFLYTHMLQGMQAKLADALSRPRAPYTSTEPTPYEYLAPEQRHAAQVDERADIYAFGVLLYRMLTGQAPGSFTQLPSTCAENVAPQWDTVVTTCLAEYPIDRYRSAEKLLEALKGIGRAAKAPAPGAPSDTVQVDALQADVAAAAAAAASRAREMPQFRRPVKPKSSFFSKVLMLLILVGAGAAIYFAIPLVKKVLNDDEDQPSALTNAGDGSGGQAAKPPRRGGGNGKGTGGSGTKPKPKPRPKPKPNPKPNPKPKPRPNGGSSTIMEALRDQAQGKRRTAEATRARLIATPKPKTPRETAVARMKRLSAISTRTPDAVARAFMDPSRLKRSTSSPDARKAFYMGQAAREPADKIKHYTKAVTHDPRYAWAYVQRGFAYFFDRDYIKALTDYSKAIEIDDRDYVPYYCRALTFEKLGKQREADHDYKRAEQRAPKSTPWYIHAGNDYAMKGQYAQAIEQYTKAIELDPKIALAYNNRGVAYSESKKYTEAVADLTRAIKLDGNNFQSYFNRGYAYLRMGKFDEAIDDNTTALGIKPASPQALYNRGYAYEKKGDKARSRADYEEAYRLVAPKSSGERIFD